MKIKGRLTENAEIRETKFGKLAANFTISITDHDRAKNGRRKKNINLVKCNYWVNPAAVDFLYKGTLVELKGCIGTDTWINEQGVERDVLMFKTSNIKILCIRGKVDVIKVKIDDEQLTNS